MVSPAALNKLAEELWDMDDNRVPKTHYDINVQVRSVATARRARSPRAIGAIGGDPAVFDGSRAAARGALTGWPRLVPQAGKRSYDVGDGAKEPLFAA